MKSVKNKNNIIYTLLVSLVVLISVAVRFYNFKNRITYGPEQARSLIVAAQNLKYGLSLLGQEYFRYSSSGHKLFYSATFTYSLIPLILLFDYDYVGVAGYFAILNLITGLAIYLVAKKITHKTAALFSLILFLFNSYMIYHSMFLWSYNYLPLLGVLSLYIIYLFRIKQKSWHPFVLGVISGIGFGIQFLYLPYALVFLVFLLTQKCHRLAVTLLFSIGAIIGNLPMVLFDLRNNFYHFFTLAQYLNDTVKGVSDASFNYYYLLPLPSVLSILLGWLLYKIYQKSKMISIVLFICYFFFNLKSPLIDFKKPTGMPIGLTWKEIKQSAQVVANDKPENFNLAELLDFDTRGYILRYPVEYIYGYKPMGVEEYPNTKNLYVLSGNDYDYTNPKVWELQVMMPYDVKLMAKVNDDYGVYKITRK
jgi:hypothetical protein